MRIHSMTRSPARRRLRAESDPRSSTAVVVLTARQLRPEPNGNGASMQVTPRSSPVAAASSVKFHVSLHVKRRTLAFRAGSSNHRCCPPARRVRDPRPRRRGREARRRRCAVRIIARSPGVERPGVEHHRGWPVVAAGASLLHSPIVSSSAPSASRASPAANCNVPTAPRVRR
jgi:hypothetical protein